MDFDRYSLFFLASALPIYTLGFIAYTVAFVQSIAGVSSHSGIGNSPDTRTHNTGVAYGDANKVGTLVKVANLFGKTHKLFRVATVLSFIGVVLHGTSVILRGIAAGRVPWANMYEFALTSTFVCVLVFLSVARKVDLNFLAPFFFGLIVIFLGSGLTLVYVPISPLPPALHSYWLIIHILVAILATGFFMLGALLSGLQLSRNVFFAQSRLIPNVDFLENIAYKLNVIGFVFWSFTLVAGAIWAEKAWGRFWGWDTKEIWTFIIWILYAAYIHARATAG
ncbi:cytochrome c biogenesis protein CcsA, partial [Tropheryma whipplei]